MRILLFSLILAATFFQLSGATQAYAQLLYVSNRDNDDFGEILRYNANSGRFIDVFVELGSGGLANPQDFVFGPDGNLYVVDQATDQVFRYDGVTGEFIDIFVTAVGGGLNNPNVLRFGPDGNLYVGSQLPGQVRRYDGATGAFIDVFASGSGLGGFPSGLIFGPDGNLYVSSFSNDRVIRYDGATGNFIDNFVTTGDGGLNGAANLLFEPDGNLLVVSVNSDQVLRYNGNTGGFINIAASGGGLNNPTCVDLGPDGNLYVNDAGTIPGNILKYSNLGGIFLGVFIPEGRGGLESPTCLLFRNDQPAPSLAVPTLSQWGLIAMAGLLGIIGFKVIRRRQTV